MKSSIIVMHIFPPGYIFHFKAIFLLSQIMKNKNKSFFRKNDLYDYVCFSLNLEYFMWSLNITQHMTFWQKVLPSTQYTSYLIFFMSHFHFYSCFFRNHTIKCSRCSFKTFSRNYHFWWLTSQIVFNYKTYFILRVGSRFTAERRCQLLPSPTAQAVL